MDEQIARRFKEFLQQAEKDTEALRERMRNATSDMEAAIALQIQEILRLTNANNRIAAKWAPADELLQLYEHLQKQRPNLTLRTFLEENGAEHRYRAIVNRRSQQRKKGGPKDNPR